MQPSSLYRHQRDKHGSRYYSRDSISGTVPSAALGPIPIVYFPHAESQFALPTVSGSSEDANANPDAMTMDASALDESTLDANTSNVDNGKDPKYSEPDQDRPAAQYDRLELC